MVRFGSRCALIRDIIEGRLESKVMVRSGHRWALVRSDIKGTLKVKGDICKALK